MIKPTPCYRAKIWGGRFGGMSYDPRWDEVFTSEDAAIHFIALEIGVNDHRVRDVIESRRFTTKHEINGYDVGLEKFALFESAEDLYEFIDDDAAHDAFWHSQEQQP